MSLKQVAPAESIRIMGKVTTAFGIKGWVKVYSYTEPMTNLLEFKHWQLRVDGRWQSYKVLQGKLQGKGLVAALEGITDRDKALALSQCEIGVAESELPELGDKEHYWFQLLNLSVVNTDGVRLGQVKEIFDSGGGNQVMVVKPDSDSCDQQERLLPFVDQIVLDVDLDQQLIEVDWDSDF